MANSNLPAGVTLRDIDNLCREPDYEDYDGDDCPDCGGAGWIVDECFEDTCCCIDPELTHNIIPCPTCNP